MRSERILVAVAMAVLWAVGPFCLAPGSLGAQDLRPLAPDHWSRELQEVLHTLGIPGVSLPLVGGVSGRARTLETVRALEALRAVEPGATARAGALASLLEGWLGRLAAETGPERGGAFGSLETGWEEDPSLPVSSPRGYGALLLAGGPSENLHLWGELLMTQAAGGEALRALGLTLPLGGLDLFLGRLPLAMGQGADPLLLTGRIPLDGAFLTSREPFLLPGFLGGMGPSSLHLGLTPFFSTPTASRAWLHSFALGFAPHPRVDVGVLRTIRFAGEGLEGWSPENVLGMLTALGEDNAFDDSQGELAVRVRWSLGGQSLGTYLSLGFEDRASVYEDPGILVGALLPVVRSGALLTLRYEFQAFGARGRWCRSCPREHHAWYRHPAFGDYLLKGLPLGSDLGGYGASHRLRGEGWLARLPLRGWVEAQRVSRGRSNIFLDRSSRRVEALRVGAEAFVSPGLTLGGEIRSLSLDGREEVAFGVGIGVLGGFRP